MKKIKLKPTIDAAVWYKKWSTWLAGVATSAIATYVLLPDDIKASIPQEILLGLGLASMLLVPVATSVNQKSCEPKE